MTTKKDWILMAAANACGGGHHHICAEDLEYIETIADLLEKKGYLNPLNHDPPRIPHKENPRPFAPRSHERTPKHV